MDLFYIIILICAEISSILLSYNALRVMKEAKADGKVTKEEYKEIFLIGFVAVSIGIAIILAVLKMLKVW